MGKFLKELFLIDDRTGKRSSTKTVRMSIWLISILWIFFCVGMIIWSVSGNVVPPESEKFIDSVSQLIIFLFGGCETSYQMNRSQKMKHGSLEVAKDQPEVITERI